jgi:predicted Zn-dependent protease
LYFTGLAYQRDFVLDSAFYFIKRTSLLYPNDKEVLEQLYAVASMVGEYNDARKALMDLIAKGDPLEKHLENLVDMLYKSGSIANLYYYLVKWYREYGLEDQSRFRMLASYAAKVDSFEVANEVLDSAVKRWGDSDDFELVRSEILFNEGKMADAEKILRALVAKYPDNLDFKSNLANCLSNQNKIPKIDEALEIMKQIRSQVPNPVKIDSVITQMEDHREQVLHPEAERDSK